MLQIKSILGSDPDSKLSVTISSSASGVSFASFPVAFVVNRENNYLMTGFLALSVTRLDYGMFVPDSAVSLSAFSFFGTSFIGFYTWDFFLCNY